MIVGKMRRAKMLDASHEAIGDIAALLPPGFYLTSVAALVLLLATLVFLLLPVRQQR